MKITDLAAAIFSKADELEISYMAVGAIAAGTYGIPRATKDIDLLVSIDPQKGITRLMDGLSSFIDFEAQTQFDTITWGRRHVGVSTTLPPYKVELFEMFDDEFVHSEFSRRIRAFVPILDRTIWLPTAEDVVVQKLRWGRPKDLEDARDVVAVQGPETLDVPYIERWCAEHGTTTRWTNLLDSLPPL